jgi:hypothetical protein
MRRREFMVMSICAVASRFAQAAPHSLLDRSTGATILLSDSAWTLALEQPALAAHARDYIALYAAEINIAGKRRHYLAAFFWSTVLGRGDFAGPVPEITLRADDRVLHLKPAAANPRDLGISRWPLKLPGPDARLAIYEVDVALLRQLSVARQVQVRPETDPTLPPELWFEEWRDGRKAFGEFTAAAFESG